MTLTKHSMLSPVNIPPFVGQADMSLRRNKSPRRSELRDPEIIPSKSIREPVFAPHQAHHEIYIPASVNGAVMSSGLERTYPGIDLDHSRECGLRSFSRFSDHRRDFLPWCAHTVTPLAPHPILV
ncbi:hypothetical protein Tco_1431112 [Tanacetum coccineum]